jgi:hypothetical protein
MKVAIVDNLESQNVINPSGAPNGETIGLKTIQRIANALKNSGLSIAETSSGAGAAFDGLLGRRFQDRWMARA